jgi:chromosomal replication initiator protein
MAGHMGEGQDPRDLTPAVGHILPLEQELRSAVSSRLGPTRYTLWFGGKVRLGFDSEGKSVIVRVPDPFIGDWIERHYKPSLIDAVEAVVGRPLPVRVQVDEHDHPTTGGLSGSESSPGEPGGQVRAESVGPNSESNCQEPDRSDRLSPACASRLEASRFAIDTVAISSVSTNPETRPRPLRELEAFVTGPGNRVAFAAASEIAQTAGTVFSPLMIHSATGLGKTHLLEGIHRAMQQFHPELDVVRMSAEAFTNSFVESMRSGTLTRFRAQLRTAGSLIVDDVHFLAAKRATMIEFLYTYDALYDRGSPIVLAADQHPRQIARLSDELVTRFLAGIVVKIEPPDLVTRQAILRAKAVARRALVPEEVISYIAAHLTGSIRELEGALYTVIAQSALNGRLVNLPLARSALRETIRCTTVAIGVRDVEKAVCELFEAKAEALRSERRAQVVAFPRMVAMYLCRKHTVASYAEIGRHFGGRNHTTVMAAERKINKWLESERKIALLPGFETIGELMAHLEHALGAATAVEA